MYSVLESVAHLPRTSGPWSSVISLYRSCSWASKSCEPSPQPRSRPLPSSLGCGLRVFLLLFLHSSSHVCLLPGVGTVRLGWKSLLHVQHWQQWVYFVCFSQNCFPSCRCG